MKEDQRVVLTKRMLREGLLRLAQTEDIGTIKVSRLCQEAGINRATFYRHYQSPHDIIVEIRREMFQDIKQLAQKDDALREPQKWLEHMCQYFYDRMDLLRILFRCRTDDAFIAMINSLYREQFDHFRSFGIGEGMDDDELRLATYWVAGGVYYILRQWITEPICKSPQEIARIMYTLLYMPGAEA